MITVTEATKQVLEADDIALQALMSDILNLSAYAEKVIPEVEAIACKKVKKGSVVVALSRIGNDLVTQSPLKPDFYIDNLSIKSSLVSVSFDKIPETKQKLSTLNQALDFTEQTFFTVTQSTSEITLILHQELFPNLLAHFGSVPKAVFTDQVAISVQFSEKYLEMPNVLYLLQSSLAVQRINITEIVSTYTEFCFIIAKEDADQATQILKRFMK